MQPDDPNDRNVFDERDVRALTSCLTVLPEYGRAKGAAGLYMVVSDSGREYLVDTDLGACECPDFEYREPAEGCKHIRRVRFATGERDVPEGVPADAVDELLGEHVDADPNAGKPVAADGGVVARRAGERTRVPVSGGVLVYEQRAVGRELIGFEDVESWDDLRGALAARGHSVGAAHHLPVLDEGRSEPRRSEPASFGGGETTGVQDL